jgi:hypothetical protein
MDEIRNPERPALPEPARQELAAALRRLRAGRGLMVRLADLMGSLIASAGQIAVRALARLPREQALAGKLQGVVQAALTRALDLEILGVRPDAQRRSRTALTRAAVAFSGAFGGLYGLAGLMPDVTFTTLAIMRGIARIAQEQGEDLRTAGARAACLQVFYLASPPEPGSTAEELESDLSYFSARLLLQGRTVIALIEQVAARYGIVLSRKLALQAVPVAGAVTGAALNDAFLRHYLDLATAHFTIRRLERTYGEAAVRQAAAELAATLDERF